MRHVCFSSRNTTRLVLPPNDCSNSINHNHNHKPSQTQPPPPPTVTSTTTTTNTRFLNSSDEELYFLFLQVSDPSRESGVRRRARLTIVHITVCGAVSGCPHARWRIPFETTTVKREPPTRCSVVVVVFLMVWIRPLTLLRCHPSRP